MEPQKLLATGWSGAVAKLAPGSHETGMGAGVSKPSKNRPLHRYTSDPSKAPL